jgi:hypothetical protein
MKFLNRSIRETLLLKYQYLEMFFQRLTIQETAANTFIGNGLYGDVYFSSNGGDNWSSNTGQFMATYTGNLAKAVIIYCSAEKILE